MDVMTDKKKKCPICSSETTDLKNGDWEFSCNNNCTWTGHFNSVY